MQFYGKVLLDCLNKEFTDVPKATSITPFELYTFNCPLYPPNGNSFGEYYYCTYVEGVKSLLRNPVRIYLNPISPHKIMFEDQKFIQLITEHQTLIRDLPCQTNRISAA